MLGDPQVVAALNHLNQLEIGLHEALHGWEKVYQCGKYKKLRKWVDKQVNATRDRRRYFEQRVIRLGGVLEISMASSTVDPATSTSDFLEMLLEAATELWSAYQSAYLTIEAAKDYTTADDVCQWHKKVESCVFTLEAFQRQITDMGLPVFLSTQV